MQAHVYKSLRKADAYLFLANRDGFGVVPPAVLQPLGKLQFVLEVELSADRSLARSDPAVVRENLSMHGFHLQLPATQDDPMTEDHGTDA